MSVAVFTESPKGTCPSEALLRTVVKFDDGNRLVVHAQFNIVYVSYSKPSRVLRQRLIDLDEAVGQVMMASSAMKHRERMIAMGEFAAQYGNFSAFLCGLRNHLISKFRVVRSK